MSQSNNTDWVAFTSRHPTLDCHSAFASQGVKAVRSCLVAQGLEPSVSFGVYQQDPQYCAKRASQIQASDPTAYTTACKSMYDQSMNGSFIKYMNG